jgi:hypothetical protein
MALPLSILWHYHRLLPLFPPPVRLVALLQLVVVPQAVRAAQCNPSPSHAGRGTGGHPMRTQTTAQRYGKATR